MPRAGKTTQIERLREHLEGKNLKVAVVTDRERAERIKTPPSEGFAYALVFFSMAIDEYYKYLPDHDYLLIDRGFNDVAVWADVHYGFGEISVDECQALKICFARFAKKVDTSIYFEIPVSVALARHAASGEHQAVDDVAMNRKWLEALDASYQKNKNLFHHLMTIDGLQSPDVIEQHIKRDLHLS